ncbi:MAG: hypothetical protein K8F26_01680 [Thiobacillus sp.]|nr:hypothetical protein [Thiobacillus sp.]
MMALEYRVIEIGRYGLPGDFIVFTDQGEAEQVGLLCGSTSSPRTKSTTCRSS